MKFKKSKVFSNTFQSYPVYSPTSIVLYHPIHLQYVSASDNQRKSNNSVYYWVCLLNLFYLLFYLLFVCLFRYNSFVCPFLLLLWLSAIQITDTMWWLLGVYFCSQFVKHTCNKYTIKICNLHTVWTRIIFFLPNYIMQCEYC